MNKLNTVKIKPTRMCCIHGDKCKEECGHKIEHTANTGCLNACVVVAELTCKPIKKKR